MKIDSGDDVVLVGMESQDTTVLVSCSLNFDTFISRIAMA